MRRTTSFCLVILMVVIAGCSPSDTLMPDFTLNAALHGNWLVETMNANEGWSTLGTLVIDGHSYHFYSAPAVEIPSWMQDQFHFFEQPTGEFMFEYEPDVSPDDDVRTFEDNAILLRAGIGGETFLIRVDQDHRELYLHSQLSEIQVYRIHKSYDG